MAKAKLLVISFKGGSSKGEPPFFGSMNIPVHEPSPGVSEAESAWREPLRTVRPKDRNVPAPSCPVLGHGYSPQPMPAEYFETQVGSDNYWLLNLDHPTVEQKVVAEMEAGVEVYYDRRWGATAVLTDWLAQNLSLIIDKKILILGAGVGAETLLLGAHGKHVWLNDLAPTALELCAEQMQKNGLSNFTLLAGRYEQLDLPKVDLVVGSFLIYNDETLAAMEDFLRSHEGRVILVNERLAPFPKFLINHDHEIAFEDESGAVGVLC